jgi:hypothetical protein
VKDAGQKSTQQNDKKRAYAVMIEMLDVVKNIALEIKEIKRLAKETIKIAKVKTVIAVAQNLGNCKTKKLK